MVHRISKTNHIIEELKSATGWNGIAETNSGYVITFNESDAHLIRGLSKNNSTFYLEFDSFSDIPLCFHIIRHGRHFQYWTIHNQLHRSDDKPAYIMYDPGGNRYHQRWYWHGLLHRLGGPAEEFTQGYKVDKTSYDSHIKEEFKSMEMEWWREGVISNGLNGIPIWAKIEDGWRCKNKTTGLLDWPDDEWPAFYAKKVKIEWSNTGGRLINYNGRTDSTDELRPMSLLAFNFSETYSQGKLNIRSCEFFEMEWAQGVKEINTNSDNIILFNNTIRDDLLTELNLWNGRLLGDSETELILLSEFNRICKSEKLD